MTERLHFPFPAEDLSSFQYFFFLIAPEGIEGSEDIGVCKYLVVGDAMSLGRGVALVVSGVALSLPSLLGGGEASVIGSKNVMDEAGLENFSTLNGGTILPVGGFLGDSF